MHDFTNVDDDGSIPAKPEYNWHLYNNFRSGDLSPADGKAAPDLTLEASICQAMCLEKSLLVWVNLGNEGASPLTAGAVIRVFGKKGADEALITEQPFFGQLDAGKYADAIGFQIGAEGYDQLIIRAVANEEECKLDNNELALDPPFCNPPG